MKIDHLLSEIRSRWPRAVDLTDAENVGNEGFRSWTLIRTEEEVRKKILNEAGLLKAAAWPFYQSLHSVAKKMFVEGKDAVLVENVELAAFEPRLREALEHPSWSVERQEFERWNGPV